MKPPVTIDGLMSEWSKDTIIDSSSMEKELLKISFLHGKYLNIMSYHRHMIRKIEADYKEMKEIRRDYYQGHTGLDTLEKYGWDVFPFTLKSDITTYLDADEDINKYKAKKILHEEIVDVCIAIIKELNSRTYQLRDFIAWERFVNGG